MQKVYSYCGDLFYREIGEAIDHFIWEITDNLESCDEKEIDLYEGEEGDKATISKYAPDVAEHLLNEAYSDAGEITDGWLGQGDQEELQLAFEEWLEKYANEKSIQPRFYSVKNVKKIKVKMSFDKKGNYTIL
jgi:hypothetical protein